MLNQIKKIFVSSFFIFTGFCVQAGVIYDTDITGADLTGLQVTANFTNGNSETLLWQEISRTLGNTGNTIVDHEGFSGGVTGAGWGLSQQGFTTGDFDVNGLYGVWRFFDSTNTVSSFELDALNTGIVFDTVFLTDLSQDINGSAQGRPFFAFNNFQLFSGATAQYSNPIDNELYSRTTVSLTNAGSEFSFWLDTDRAINVNEPSLFVVFTLLCLLMLSRRFINVKSVNEYK